MCAMYGKLKQILYRHKLTREGVRWVAAAGYIKSASPPASEGADSMQPAPLFEFFSLQLKNDVAY